jgi:hypothetical protein
MSRPQPRGMPDELAARYRGGDPIVLVGRYSSPHGVKARESAVNDLLGAVDLLATFGIDIRRDLPTVADLARQLKDAKPVRSVGADKKSFTNRFVAVDLRAVHGVYIVLSVGTLCPICHCSYAVNRRMFDFGSANRPDHSSGLGPRASDVVSQPNKRIHR